MLGGWNDLLSRCPGKRGRGWVCPPPALAGAELGYRTPSGGGSGRTRDKETCPEPLSLWRGHTPQVTLSQAPGPPQVGVTLGDSEDSTPGLLPPPEAPSEVTVKPRPAFVPCADGLLLSSCAPSCPWRGQARGRRGHSDH